MSDFTYPVLFVIAAYMLGSVPFAIVSSRLFRLADPRSYGSGNPGATNVLRSGNKKAAIVTLIGDCLKGWVSVYLALRYADQANISDLFPGVVACAVFFGHLYPIFLRFKGGKGVATGAGVLFALNPALGGVVLAIWVTVFFALRYSSLAALMAAAAAPVVACLLWGAHLMVGFVGVIALALIARHWANLERLLAGKEPKVGAGKR